MANTLKITISFQSGIFALSPIPVNAGGLLCVAAGRVTDEIVLLPTTGCELSGVGVGLMIVSGGGLGIYALLPTTVSVDVTTESVTEVTVTVTHVTVVESTVCVTSVSTLYKRSSVMVWTTVSVIVVSGTVTIKSAIAVRVAVSQDVCHRL
jgi:hypothetical protein